MSDVAISSFAEIAVELSVAKSTGDVDIAELVWATWVQAAYASDRAVKIDILAAQIGLSEDATAHILGAERKHRERLAEAHDLMKRLIPHEAEVRALLARVEPGAERRVWQRLVDFVRGRR